MGRICAAVARFPFSIRGFADEAALLAAVKATPESKADFIGSLLGLGELSENGKAQEALCLTSWRRGNSPTASASPGITGRFFPASTRFSAKPSSKCGGRLGIVDMGNRSKRPTNGKRSES